MKSFVVNIKRMKRLSQKLRQLGRSNSLRTDASRLSTENLKIKI
jgi:hypothetical protein